MKNGKFTDETKTLRAKIDMKSTNFHMRDPILYRIKTVEKHYRTFKKWYIYPTYDFAHVLSDVNEKITHSLCTTEFTMHKPLYIWIMQKLNLKGVLPKQIEFSRLNLTYTITSKRNLLKLIEKKYVNGWDDPRMPTIAGMKKRGYPPNAILKFCEKIGLSKRNNIISISLLESYVREELNKISYRVMVVLNPIKLIIDNYPKDKIEYLSIKNNPINKLNENRIIPFTKIIYIEKQDFMEFPKNDFHRLSIGNKVKLKYSYIIYCKYIKKDKNNNITSIHCEYYPSTLNKIEYDNQKIKSIIHWVPNKYFIKINVKLYDKLFTIDVNNLKKNENIMDYYNNNSIKKLNNCYSEPSIMKNLKKADRFQFERLGYFYLDKNISNKKITFNKTIDLNSSYKSYKDKIIKKDIN